MRTETIRASISSLLRTGLADLDVHGDQMDGDLPGDLFSRLGRTWNPALAICLIGLDHDVCPAPTAIRFSAFMCAMAKVSSVICASV